MQALSHTQAPPRHQRSAVHLPPELWTYVFAWLHAEVDAEADDFLDVQPTAGRRPKLWTQMYDLLADVSLTCRQFYELALPIRFQKIRLNAHSRQSNRNRQATPSEIFRRLSVSPYLQNMVKILHLNMHDGSFLPPLPEPVQIMFSGMNNLEEIKVDHRFQMTPACYAHLCSLRRLQKLEVDIPYEHMADNTEASSILDSIQMQLPRGLAVTANYRAGFRADGSVEPAGPVTLPKWLTSIVLSPITTHLHLTTRLIRLPFTNYLSRHISATLLHLETIRILAPRTLLELEDLKNFIVAAPLISKIVLQRDREEAKWRQWSNATWHPYSEEDVSIVSTALPNLQTFVGPLIIASAMVPGRPVEEITINGPIPAVDNFQDQLFPLSLSSAVVRSLYLPKNENSLEFLNGVAHLFPQLEELGTSVECDLEEFQDWLVEDFSSIVNQLERLQRFTLWHSNRTNTIRVETEVVSQLSPDLPLNFLRVSPCFHHYPTDCGCSINAWTKCDGRLTRNTIARAGHAEPSIGEYHSEVGDEEESYSDSEEDEESDSWPEEDSDNDAPAASDA